MSCDKLVYDLASETEGSPNVFVRKDWINILDNQSMNYQANQSVVDTSQLSNSNKWMSYREAYFEIPLLLTIGTPFVGLGNGAIGFAGHDTMTDVLVDNTTADGCIGLKNWFGNIIHSFTVDYNGTTIIQQTPFVNMWNSFKLLTTLSWQDVMTQGAHIGFYPDTSTSWYYTQRAAVGNFASGSGDGISNNVFFPHMSGDFDEFTPSYSTLGQSVGNIGYSKRMRYIAYDPSAPCGVTQPGAAIISTSSCGLLPASQSATMWRSFITGASGAAVKGYVQHQIMATVYLKHLHSFFNMCPLLKGVYMKMTMNLNNSSATIYSTPSTPAAGGNPYGGGTLLLQRATNAVGGVIPFMVSSAVGTSPSLDIANMGQASKFSGGCSLTNYGVGNPPQTYYTNISVGGQVLDADLTSVALTGCSVPRASGVLAQSVYLYVPAYTFNPVFEQAYLSSPVKTIKYTDVYQYQIEGVTGTFNRLITNGIANIKSVLIIPFLSKGLSANLLDAGVSPFQSPFDPAGCGTTSPVCSINNFNVVISGQNAIYNTERYTFEHFVNQVYGQGAVNGGLTDGLTSGLINFKDWQNSYCYYYTNVERMLPVEQSVPKSVQIQGVIQSGTGALGVKSWDFWVFVEYGAQIQIDSITGARV